MTEKELQQAVVDLARLLGWRVYHTYDSRRSTAGFPDLTLVRGSRLVFVELKAEKGRASIAQLTWLRDLSAAGADTYLWRPADWLSGHVEDALRMT